MADDIDITPAEVEATPEEVAPVETPVDAPADVPAEAAPVEEAPAPEGDDVAPAEITEDFSSAPTAMSQDGGAVEETPFRTQ